MSEDKLDEVKSVRFLGSNTDSQLNWNDHISQVCFKVSSGIYALRQMAKISSIQTLKQIYFALIDSHISFGLCLYGATANNNLNRILVLQKKAVRIILKLGFQDSVKDHFKSLGFLTVYGQYIYQLIIHIRSNLEQLPKLGTTHDYNTRNRQQPIFDKHRLEIFTKKPSYAGIRFYNHLPIEIKQIASLNSFKSKLKYYITEKSIYSFEEFFV